MIAIGVAFLLALTIAWWLPGTTDEAPPAALRRAAPDAPAAAPCANALPPLRTVAADAAAAHGADADTAAPNHAFVLEVVRRGSSGLLEPAHGAAFGLADSAIVDWTAADRLADGAASFRWNMRTPRTGLIVDTGHLRRLQLVGGQPFRVTFDASLEAPFPGQEPPPPPPPPPADDDSRDFGPDLQGRILLCEAAETNEEPRYYSTSSAFGTSRTGMLHGRVRDARGARVPEPFVQVRAGDLVVQTSGDSRRYPYEFVGLPYGTYEVTATSPLGGRACAEVVIDRAEVSLDLQLAAALSVCGQVVDLSGTAIADARVLWTTDAGDWRNRTVTAKDGTFAIHDVDGAPGTVWVCASSTAARLPGVARRGVVPGGDQLVLTLDRTTCCGSLRVDPVLPPGLPPDLVSVRVWQRDSNLGVRMSADERHTSFVLDQLPAGHYDVEVVCPGLGVTTGGPYWIDGRSDAHVTDICLPEPGRVTFAGPAPKQHELVRHRADVDLRIVDGAAFAGPHLLREGDYTLLWQDAAGVVQQRAFHVEAGREQTLQL